MPQLFYLVMLALVAAGVIALQIFLSKQKHLLPGLVLPFISFLFSVVMVCSMAAYTRHTVQQRVNGVVISTQSQAAGNASHRPGGPLAVFLVGNLPTLILLGIDWGCHPRTRHRRREELDRMHIQDL